MTEIANIFAPFFIQRGLLCVWIHIIFCPRIVKNHKHFLSCSFDLRQQSLDDQGKIWASESNSKMARAQLFTHSEPTAVLALHGVTQEDAGTYRCRVDFKRSPTRYRKIALDVIGKFYIKFDFDLVMGR